MKQDDWRVPLKEGAVLHNKYVVRKCVASGASCLLYDCWYADSQGNSVDVYVKEFYPKEPENAITRSAEDGKSLKWKIQYLTQKPRRLIKFKEACKHLNLFYKDKSLCMNTSYQQDTFDENETSYNVVAKSYAGVSGDDYENVKTIKDILQLVLKLTYVIKEYHQKGYLHLDIKPANYLVAEDASHEKIIQLYDLDSIVPIDQFGHIKPGNSITYTTGFCAPEIEMLESGFTWEAVSQIGTWTDIYSLGMILLNLICGPVPVSFYDSDNDASFYLNSSLHSESPVFEHEAGESINPAAQSKVKSILTNCLESFYLDRIQTTSDLINELESAIALCQSPYVLTSIGSSIGCFMGRETELHQIEDRFAKGNGICIAFGPGGTGKTCFAHEYWRRNKSRYNVGVYLDYAGGHDSNDKGSMDGLLSSVELRSYDDNPNSENYEKKRNEKIRELLNKEDVLILLDNFDMPNDPARAKAYKAIFKDLQDNFSNADIIITTRTDLFGMSDGILSSNTTQINIGGLPFEQSFTLFAQNCERDVKGQEESYRKLYDFENGNTLALHILSRLYHKDTHRYNAIEDIYQKLCQGQALGGIKVYREEKAGEALCHIFDVAELPEEDQNILSIVYLFRRTDLNNEMVYKMYGDDDGDEIINKLNDLVIAGWVTKSNESFFIHPLVKYAVKEKIKPTIEQFPKLQPYEFYMYFSFSYIYDLLDPKTQKIKKRMHILNLHFEKYEEEALDNIVFPAETPFLIHHTHSPFFDLIKAQTEGKIGYNISIDPRNPYYESKGNCIFTQKGGTYGDDNLIELLFMSINNAEIPTDKNIGLIHNFSCSYNKNETITIPDTVTIIQGQAFSHSKSNVIRVPKSVEVVCHRAFSNIGSDTSIIFQSLPETLVTSAFALSTANVIFQNSNVEWIDNVLVSHDEETLECVRQTLNDIKSNAEVIVPECVKKIEKQIYVLYPARTVHEPLSLRLNCHIESIDPGVLKYFDKITMNGDGDRYCVVNDALIEKGSDKETGTVFYCWGDIPTASWINAIGQRSMRTAAYDDDIDVESSQKYSQIVVPENIQKICGGAFVNASFESIQLPKTISFIGDAAFSSKGLKKIQYDGTKSQWDAIPKSERWFSGMLI